MPKCKNDIVNQDFLLDHCNIRIKIALPRPPKGKITITHQNPDRIYPDNLKLNLTAKLNTIRNFDNVQDLYNRYMQAINSTLEIHTPEVNKITKKEEKFIV